MEEKQLDFNAPLLSVRRLSSTLASSDGMNKKITEKSQPNRQHSLPLYKSDWELGEVTKPAAVPFHWEWVPGRAKDGSETHLQPPKRILDIIKHVSDDDSENQNVFKRQIESSHLNTNSTLLEVLNPKEGSSLEGEDDAYSDAIDTLSQTESFSWNCTVSCLSGYDGPDVKPSGTFSTDPKTRDFMMSRFLPAAKAMILETPQYVPRKQPVVNERPVHAKKVVSGELKPLIKPYRSNTISNYDQHLGDVESEDEEDKYDDLSKKSRKACGFLPRLCVTNSLYLLNPVPGMKSRAQSPMSSAGGVRRLARTAYSGPLPQTHEKHNWEAAYRKKSQSRELHEVENKLAGKSNRFSGGRISPYRNEAPQSPFYDGARFLGIPKKVENVEPNKFSSISNGCNKFLDVSAHQMYKGLGSVNPVVEKTLYVDSVNNVKVPILNLDSSRAEGLKKYSGETLVESRGVDESSIAKSFGSLDADLPPSTCISNLRSKADQTEVLKLDHESRAHTNGELGLSNERSMNADDKRKPCVESFQSPLPPPLPKSPSESWLWRTMPTINPFSHHPRKQAQKTSATGAKWETIVKTSHVHHDHVRYSEELIPHLSQHSKT